MHSNCDQVLFAYGTLQRGDVQLAELGRQLSGAPDRLRGFRMVRLPISDAQEALHNGAPFYPAIVADGRTDEAVDGTLYGLTSEELLRADRYEGHDYVRQRITLASGIDAWVYVAAQPHEVEA